MDKASKIHMANREMKSWEMGAKLRLTQLELNDAACREEWLRADRRRLIKEERFYRGERERLLEEVEKKEKMVKEKGKVVKKWMAHVKSTNAGINRLRLKADVAKVEIQKLENIKIRFQNEGSSMQKDLINLISDKVVLKQNLKAKDDTICVQLQQIKKLLEERNQIVCDNRRVYLANQKLVEENTALEQKSRRPKLPKMPNLETIVRCTIKPYSNFTGLFSIKPFM